MKPKGGCEWFDSQNGITGGYEPAWNEPLDCQFGFLGKDFLKQIPDRRRYYYRNAPQRGPTEEAGASEGVSRSESGGRRGPCPRRAGLSSDGRRQCLVFVPLVPGTLSPTGLGYRRVLAAGLCWGEEVP